MGAKLIIANLLPYPPFLILFIYTSYNTNLIIKLIIKAFNKLSIA